MARVLLADSQPIFNEALEVLLLRDGKHEPVVCAPSPVEILATVRRQSIDLVLLDAGLALTGSPALLESIKAVCEETKVVLLTTRLDVNVTVAAVQAGAVGVVSKTSATRVVLRIVEVVLAGEAAIPRALLPPVLRRLVEIQRTGCESAIDRLSPREREVLALLGQGWSNRQIGDRLYISPHTARTHVQNILEKLELHTRLEAATYAMRELDMLASS